MDYPLDFIWTLYYTSVTLLPNPKFPPISPKTLIITHNTKFTNPNFIHPSIKIHFSSAVDYSPFPITLPFYRSSSSYSRKSRIQVHKLRDYIKGSSFLRLISRDSISGDNFRRNRRL